jgi:hypothetical protein
MAQHKRELHLKLTRQNIRAVNQLYPNLAKHEIEVLRQLTKDLRLAVVAGEVLRFDSAWYITHAGLLRIAHRKHCTGILTEIQKSFCDPESGRWVFKASVYKSTQSRPFVGYGDADPSNVSQLVRGAEMRVAETRAVNRALRKAYGIGICSVEEIGSDARSAEPAKSAKKLPSQSVTGNGWKSQPKLRDRLCQLIRQHQIDPILVKSYAVDFCGTKTLKEASREQVEKFVVHLADWATKDKNALVCQLNSYVRSEGAA